MFHGLNFLHDKSLWRMNMASEATRQLQRCTQCGTLREPCPDACAICGGRDCFVDVVFCTIHKVEVDGHRCHFCENAENAAKTIVKEQLGQMPGSGADAASKPPRLPTIKTQPSGVASTEVSSPKMSPKREPQPLPQNQKDGKCGCCSIVVIIGIIALVILLLTMIF